MATLLLVIIFIAFIGLGIPDSLLGAAWPAIHPELGLPISTMNAVTVLTTSCTILSSLLSAKIINRFGVARVVAVSTAMTAAALLGISFSRNLLWICLCAPFLGLGGGAIDAGLNNYVALHYKATHMNFLHCFYGVGVSVSPFLMSFALATMNWRDGYRSASYIQIGIAVLLFLTMPVWRRVKHGPADTAEEEAVRTVPFRELIKIPAVRQVYALFFASCAIEVVAGGWGSSFLVGSKGMSEDRAAAVITLYYVGMALGRFLSGVLSAKLSPWRIIYIGEGTLLVALLALLLPLPAELCGAALFLIGLGNAPLFPNLTHLTPINFGREISQSVIGTQMAVAYTGILLMPMLFGFLAQFLSTDIFPLYLALIFVLMAVSTLRFVRLVGRRGEPK